mmetsp:Transcript_153401/g.491774  ORF Transcript_153401/g.491774 Transcript_153401/m.491774 type:complete len:125 (-) Transcript_153401:327-701(-)
MLSIIDDCERCPVCKLSQTTAQENDNPIILRNANNSSTQYQSRTSEGPESTEERLQALLPTSGEQNESKRWQHQDASCRSSSYEHLKAESLRLHKCFNLSRAGRRNCGIGCAASMTVWASCRVA